MAHNIKTIEKIEDDSFMGLLASEGHIPGVTGAPVARTNGQIFEVVGKSEKSNFRGFRIVRPGSWGNKTDGGNFSGGAFAH